MSARRRLRRVLSAIIVTGLLAATAACGDSGPGRSGTGGSSAQDEARKKQVQAQFSSWDGSHKGLTKYIKQSLKDPGSFEHLKTDYDDRLVNLVVTTTYRSRNAAGQIVTSTITAKIDTSGKILQVLSKR